REAVVFVGDYTAEKQLVSTSSWLGNLSGRRTLSEGPRRTARRPRIGRSERPLALSHIDRARTSFAAEGREGFRHPGRQFEQPEFRNSSRVRANPVRQKLALLD